MDDEAEETTNIISEDYLIGTDEIIPNNKGSYIPIESIDSIYSYGTLHFNTRLLSFLYYNNIPLHNFSYSGEYLGSFFPPRNASGSILINQTEVYSEYETRLKYAQEIISASIHNMTAVLKYYNRRNKPVDEFVNYLSELNEFVSSTEAIDELRGIEGNAKKTYYSAWKDIFSFPVDFTQRVKRPPNNLINSLISYGNMIVYATCLNQIYQTRLTPEIGFVHEPGDNKFALAYDIADIFKPIITDRAIFHAINKNIINQEDAFIKNGRCILTKQCKQKYVEIIENKLQTKLRLQNKDRSLTLVRIIKEECYNIVKSITNSEPYIAYRTKD